MICPQCLASPVDDRHECIAPDPLPQDTDPRWQLMKAMAKTPYSGSVRPTANYLDVTDDEFFADVARWLKGLAEVLNMAAETHVDMQRELYQLRAQRTAIREFLGLPLALSLTSHPGDE